jgi:uncharacterized membrane protein
MGGLHSKVLNNEKFESIIGRILQIGVITSAMVVFIGGIFYLAGHASKISDYHAFNRGASCSWSLSGIIANSMALNSYGIIQFGLLVLIATPILRVVFSVIAFVIQRDVTYVVVTLIVLAVLLYSLVRQGKL